MVCSLNNKCIKKFCKRTVLVQLIVKDVITFFGTQCSLYTNTNRNLTKQYTYTYIHTYIQYIHETGPAMIIKLGINRQLSKTVMIK